MITIEINDSIGNSAFDVILDIVKTRSTIITTVPKSPRDAAVGVAKSSGSWSMINDH